MQLTAARYRWSLGHARCRSLAVGSQRASHPQDVPKTLGRCCYSDAGRRGSAERVLSSRAQWVILARSNCLKSSDMKVRPAEVVLTMAGCPVGFTLSPMRDLDTIDSELRLLAAVRWSIREHGGEPSSRQVDELLDERLAHCGRRESGVLELSSTKRVVHYSMSAPVSPETIG
jgi:hypothetical protein